AGLVVNTAHRRISAGNGKVVCRVPHVTATEVNRVEVPLEIAHALRVRDDAAVAVVMVQPVTRQTGGGGTHIVVCQHPQALAVGIVAAGHNHFVAQHEPAGRLT